MFDEAGLPHAERIERVPNSRRALALGELARERGVFRELHPRLFAAYWADGRDIGSSEVLLDEGRGVGLGEEDIVQALDDQRRYQEVSAQTQQAIQLGAGGVPAWVIDRRVLVPGAQPHEVFEQVMERHGHAPIE